MYACAWNWIGHVRWDNYIPTYLLTWKVNLITYVTCVTTTEFLKPKWLNWRWGWACVRMNVWRYERTDAWMGADILYRRRMSKYCPSIYSSSVCLSVCLSACLSVCLSVFCILVLMNKTYTQLNTTCTYIYTYVGFIFPDTWVRGMMWCDVCKGFILFYNALTLSPCIGTVLAPPSFIYIPTEIGR